MEKMPENKTLLTVDEMRKVTGFSRPMAYQMVNREDFPKVRLGRRIMIPVKQLEAWIEKQVAGRPEEDASVPDICTKDTLCGDIKVKEILLKQMELLQKECNEGGSGHERPQVLASMSCAIAELSNAYAAISARDYFETTDA